MLKKLQAVREGKKLKVQGRTETLVVEFVPTWEARRRADWLESEIARADMGGWCWLVTRDNDPLDVSVFTDAASLEARLRQTRRDARGWVVIW